MNILSTKDFYKLSLDEIKALVNEVNTLANNQIRELEQTGYSVISQAYLSLQHRQGRDKPFFSNDFEGLKKEQLYSRYVSSTSFLTLKTSNVEGTKDTNIDVYKNMGYSEEKAKEIVENIVKEENTGIRTSNAETKSRSTYGADIDIKEFWKEYRRLDEEGLSATYGSTVLQSKLKTYMSQNEDYDSNNFKRWLEEKYVEEQQEEYEREEEENERLWGDEIEDEF